MGSKRAIAEESESILWEEVYPDFNCNVALRGARKRETLTQKELAHLVGVSQTHISEMEHGKRPIGKDMARRLAQVLILSRSLMTTFDMLFSERRRACGNPRNCRKALWRGWRRT
jgi:transcriptional regulator with XRE-family HTH domain